MPNLSAKAFARMPDLSIMLFSSLPVIILKKYIKSLIQIKNKEKLLLYKTFLLFLQRVYKINATKLNKIFN